MKKIIIFTLLFVISFACQNIRTPPSLVLDSHEPFLLGDSIFNFEIINELNDSLFIEFMMFPVNRYVIVYFDADCSNCISSFLDLLHKIRINDNVRYLYIGSTTNDLLLVEFYLEQNERQLNWNEYLLSDTSEFYSTYNPRIDISGLPLVIINNQFKIIGALSLYQINDVHFFSVLDELLKDSEF
jgi:hypothetical protein